MSGRGFAAYSTYVAVALHFKGGAYDFFKYSGRVPSLSEESFARRRDIGSFERLGRQGTPDEVRDLIVANMAVLWNQPKWVGDLLTDEASKRYLTWIGHGARLRYFIEEESKAVLGYAYPGTSPEMWSVPPDGGMPPVMKLAYAGRVTFDYVAASELVLERLDLWDSKISDPLWAKTSRVLRAYRPFARRAFDAEVVRAAMLKVFDAGRPNTDDDDI